MDKGRRNEIAKLKYVKRLKMRFLKEGEVKFFSLKSHGTPCSCWYCRDQKYSRTEIKKNLKRILKDELPCAKKE